MNADSQRKRLIRRLLSFVLFICRSQRLEYFILWPVSRRLLGLGYSEVIAIDDGVRMRVWLSLKDMFNRIILFYGNRVQLAWEPMTVRLFKSLAAQSKDIVIAGANIGYYVIIAAKNSKARVHAFEPVPFIREKCQENLSLNGISLHVNEEALSNVSGVATISINGGDSSLLKSKVEGEQKVIKTISLDDYCAKNRVKPDLMLLDAEGYEHMIFKGGMNMLRECDCTIIFEINYKELRRANISLDEVTSLLYMNGYSIFIIEDDYRHEKLFKLPKQIKVIPFTKEYEHITTAEFINCIAVKDASKLSSALTLHS